LTMIGHDREEIRSTGYSRSSIFRHKKNRRAMPALPFPTSCRRVGIAHLFRILRRAVSALRFFCCQVYEDAFAEAVVANEACL
jgi:hypothetical protein